MSRIKIGLIVIVIACGLMLYYVFQRESAAQLDEPLYAVEYVAVLDHSPSPVGDDQPLSRAMAAKMLSIIFYSIDEIYGAAQAHPFEDVAPDRWYAPYINAVYGLELMRGNNGRFMPDSPLTIGQAQILLRAVDPDNAPSFANIPNPDSPISYALWVELYKQLLEGISGAQTIYGAFGIKALDIIVLATSTNSGLPAGKLVSDIGAFGHAGLTMDYYIDKQIRVLVKEREIIAINTLLSSQPVLKSAYIVQINADGINAFVGGVERFFFGDSLGLGTGAIADLHIYNGRLLAASPVVESVSGKLLRASYQAIEIQGQGIFALDSNFQIYDISEGYPRRRDISNLIVGTSSAHFYLQDGVITSGVITHEEFPEQIRVVIGTSNFAGLVHSSVSITSTGNFWITAGCDEKLLELTPGQRFTISDIENTDLLGHPRLFFHSDDVLQLTGLGRNWPQGASPRYRGIIEVAREDGGYSIVNVLCIEEYLFAVVPSEMPSSYGLEAAKVQAVTARSFAVHQIMANRFHALGGNVDDSVMSQVYNNIPENEISIQAVEETRGLILWYGDDVVRANFFSTSAGVTANAGEVWASGSTFPGHTPNFLQSRPQFPGYPIDLSDETRAAAFFRNDTIDAYDSHSPWFRWTLEMTPAEIAASVNAQSETPIGNFIDMRVLRRGEGGNIMELLIIGDQAEITVLTELNIRNMLRPSRAASGDRDIVVSRHDGSTLLNLSMLPSAFFTFEVTDEVITFHGGGHGHGVGMSQTGVRGMVDRGYSFEEILAHFYPNVMITGF